MITTTARRARALLAATTMASLLAACTTRPPTDAPATYEAQAQQVQAGAADTRPWWCNAAGDGTPLSGHGNGHIVDPHYAGRTKGPLAWADCLALSRQLDQLTTAIRPYDTKGKAIAAGSMAAGNYTKGLGTHHSFPGGRGWTFDPARPSFLIYGGDAADAPLMGVAFVHLGATPPPAFAGENDWWHKHRKVCFEKNPASFPPRDLGEAEEISDEQCAALGGVQTDLGSGAWLLHMWLPPHEYRLDLFASGHNCLLETSIAPPSDACWEIARRDPALGLPRAAGAAPDDGHGH